MAVLLMAMLAAAHRCSRLDCHLILIVICHMYHTFINRAGVKQTEAAMAVLLMEMLAPSASFVLHTASPLDRDTKTLHAEVAPGLGETLASGTRGSAWRLTVDKATGANHSSCLSVI